MYNLSNTYGLPAFYWLHFRASTQGFGCTFGEFDLCLGFSFSLTILVPLNFTMIDNSWYADAEDNALALKILLARLWYINHACKSSMVTGDCHVHWYMRSVVRPHELGFTLGC